MLWDHKHCWLCNTFSVSKYSSSNLSQQFYVNVLGVYDLPEGF